MPPLTHLDLEPAVTGRLSGIDGAVVRERAVAGDLRVAHRAIAQVSIHEPRDAEQHNLGFFDLGREPNAISEDLLGRHPGQRIVAARAVQVWALLLAGVRR